MSDLPTNIFDDGSLVAPSKYLPIIICEGSLEKPVVRARVNIERRYFTGREGWEVKDCVAMAVPQDLRYKLVRKMQRVVKLGIEGYILVI